MTDGNRDVTIASVTFRVVTNPGSDGWTAHAVRTDSDERFGIDVTSVTEQMAASLLVGWLEWQHEHMLALTRLQEAERLYHRALTGSAFATATAEDAAASIKAVNAARRALDHLRAQQPNM